MENEIKITEKSRDITYLEKTEQIVLDINGKEVRITQWNKQNNEFGDYDDDTQINQLDEARLTEEESDALDDYLREM